MLAWLLVEATFADGSTATFQVPVGLRPLEQTERFLEGKGRSFLGDVDTDDGPALVYDALVDPELALALFRHIAADEPVARGASAERRAVQHVGRLRRALHPEAVPRVGRGPNPDVEMTEALAGAGLRAHQRAGGRVAARRTRPRRRARVPRRRHGRLAARAHVAARRVREPRSTPSRPAATSRPKRHGSGASPRRCTSRWPARSGPRTAGPTTWAETHARAPRAFTGPGARLASHRRDSTARCST